MKLRALLALCVTFFVNVAVADQPAPAAPAASGPIPETPAEKAWAAANAAAIRGPASAPIRDQATLAIPEHMAFIPKAESTALMTLMGNRTGDAFVGLLMPMGQQGWFVTIEYEAAGYIRDGDAKEWKSDELFDNLKEGTIAGNEFRQQQGVKPIEVTRWVEVPAYDSATQRLVWSIELREIGTNPPPSELTINYNTYVLGREGYISMDLITDAAHVEALKPTAKELLAGVAFNGGKRYADFNSNTDKVAEYGLAALVGGIAAKKLGLFAMLGVTLAKFWKLGLIALAGLGAAVKKFFKGKDPATPPAA